jgi:hypothetical protein
VVYVRKEIKIEKVWYKVKCKVLKQHVNNINHCKYATTEKHQSEGMFLHPQTGDLLNKPPRGLTGP